MNKVAQLISAQSITPSDAWIAYRSIYLPSLRYSLYSTSYTGQELAIVQGSCPGKWVCNRLNPEVIISFIGHSVCERASCVPR
jgi:hypothetical protein